MKKKVKGGIIKNYCDCCGKLLYDLIPDGGMDIFGNGSSIPSYKMKSYIPYHTLLGRQFCSEECESKYRKLRKSQSMG